MVNKRMWPLLLLLCTTAWGADEREIVVELTVPDTTWEIAIDEVHRVGNELWVISTVAQDPDRMGAQVISKVRAALRLQAPDLPVKHFIMGKSWDWQNPEPYRFIDELGQIRAELQTGELLYRRTGKE